MCICVNFIFATDSILPMDKSRASNNPIGISSLVQLLDGALAGLRTAQMYRTSLVRMSAIPSSFMLKVVL
jgi:hypothetical protein